MSSNLIVNVFGACDLQIAPGPGGNYVDIGYSRDGIKVSDQFLQHRVDGDQNGGPEGNPIDIQYLSRKQTIRCELTKYDTAAIDIARSRLADGTGGDTGDPGTLIFATGKYFKVKLIGTTPNHSTGGPGSSTGNAKTREYLCCTVEEPHEINVGSKYSILELVFTAYPNPDPNTDTGKLYVDS